MRKVYKASQTDLWVGMPEFTQEKKIPFSQITVRFETEADLEEFSRIIGQKITPKTKSIWHPHKPHRRDFVSYWVKDE